MNTEQNKVVYNHILVRYGELSTKGKNKKDFISKLLSNVKSALRMFDKLTYEKTHDRLYILLNGEDYEAVCEKLKMVFGISSFSLAIKVDSDLELMKTTSLQIAKEFKGNTFKMDTRRHHKAFLYSSDEINRACATEILKNTELKVNVREPELRISIEVREFSTYIMTNKIKGAGGYPVGVNGKALVMLSGGIDSPVACFETMKRGVAIECIHYASPPYTSERALNKVKELASIVSACQGHIRLHIIPFTPIQLEIYKQCDESYAITIMRRMMYRLAQRVCEKQNCLAIVNGESLGQVASQTLESMNVINNVVSIPVLRPVVCMDKLEIIDIAQKIGTYEISIQPFEDCCTIFTPKNPVTKPSLKKCEKMEARMDFEPLLEEAIQNMESMNVYSIIKEENDEISELF